MPFIAKPWQQWAPIDTAPRDEDVMLVVTDSHGEQYALLKPCRKTSNGWISSYTRTRLEVRPTRWRKGTL
jgi:hypothetical protein